MNDWVASRHEFIVVVIGLANVNRIRFTNGLETLPDDLEFGGVCFRARKKFLRFPIQPRSAFLL